MRSASHRACVAALAGAIFVLFAILLLPLLQGKVFVQDDLGNFHLPLRHFYARCLERGDNFLWSPHYYGGFYLHGEGQIGLLHPAHLLIYRLLPVGVAFDLELFFCYPALLAGTYLFLRRLGFEVPASLFGALVFAFSSFNVLHHVHLNAVQIVAHLPWLLFFIDVALRGHRPTDPISRDPEAAPEHDPTSRDREGAPENLAAQHSVGWAAPTTTPNDPVGAAHPTSQTFSSNAPQKSLAHLTAWAKLAIALLTLSQILLGHPQFVIYCLMIEAAYVVFVITEQRSFAGVLGIAESKLLGLLAGAVQLLPTWEALRDSQRARPGAEFLAEGSLHPANLLQLVGPYAFKARVPSWHSELGLGYTTHEYGMYCGALLPVFAVWLWIRREHLGKYKPLVVACLVLAVAATLMAFGKYLVGTRLFAMLMGGIFRFPARHILLLQFAVAVLSAVAFWDLLTTARRSETLPWRSLWPLALVVLASLVPIALKLYFEHLTDSNLAERFSPMLQALSGPALLIGATWLVVAVARGYRFAPVLIVFFAAADLGYYGLTYVWNDPPVPLSKLLDAEEGDPDLDSGRLVATHLDRKLFALTMQGASLVSGYVALVPDRQLDYNLEDPEAEPDEELLKRWRLAGAGWLRRGGSWQRLDDPMPRAWLVTTVRESDDPQADLPEIDFTETALVSGDLPHLTGGRAGEASVETDRPGWIRLRTETDSRQLLILNETYHRGWQVTVDEQPAAVIRVNGDYLGCVIEAGTHHVQFRFAPASFRYGAYLSLVGVFLITASFCWSFFFSKS